MRFQEFRSRISSFSRSTKDSSKPSIKSASTHNDRESKIPRIMISPVPAATLSKSDVKKIANVSTSETKDYEEFLEKARKEAEKAERKKAKEIREARERNMSPWAGRM